MRTRKHRSISLRPDVDASLEAAAEELEVSPSRLVALAIPAYVAQLSPAQRASIQTRAAAPRCAA